MVGIDRIMNRSPSSGTASVLTLTTSHLPAWFGRHLCQLRRDHAARAAPWRPEIDDHRPGRVFDQRVEGLSVRHLDGFARRAEQRAAVAALALAAVWHAVALRAVRAGNDDAAIVERRR